MLIGRKYRFVFLHSRKTAGSIYVQMNRYLSDDCIQIGGWDDCLNLGGKLNKYARNQLLSLRGMKNFAPKVVNQALKGRFDVNSAIDNSIIEYYRDTGFHKNPVSR